MLVLPQDHPAPSRSNLARGFSAQRRLRRGEPRDGHPERRTGDVSQAGALEKVDRGRIARVFAADSELDVRPRLPAPRGGDFDEFADALQVDRGERAGGENSLGRIVAKKRPGIVARKRKAGLGQVIGAKRKELGGLGEFAGAQARAGGLDHRTDRIGDDLAGLGGDGVRHEHRSAP